MHVEAALPEAGQELWSDTTEPTFSGETGAKLSPAFLLTAAQLLRGVVRMLFVVVSGRALGPHVFGVYALLFAMIEMVAVASGSGYTDYLTRETARDEGVGWSLAAQLAQLRVVLSVVFGTGGLGILWLLGYPRLVLIAAGCFALTLIPRCLTEAVQGVLRGSNQYFHYLIVEIAFGAGLVSGMILLVARMGLSFVIAGELLASGAAFSVALLFARKFRSRQRPFLPVRELIKVSAIFNIYAFVSNLYDRLDVLLLSRLAGNYATGIYSVAYRPLGAVQLLPYGILYSMLPSLSRSRWNASDTERLGKAMTLLLSVAFFIVLVTMAFSDMLVSTLFGPSFAEVATALKLLIWAVIFRYLNYVLNIGLLAVRKERIFVVTSLVCLGVNLVGNFFLIPLFSWRAAAGITIITEAVLLIQNIFWFHKTLGSVPLPRTIIPIVAVFLIILSISAIGKSLGYPRIVGTAGPLLFGAYLYYRGITTDLRAFA